MKEQKSYEKAQARVEEIKGFYSHLVFFIVVNIGLFLINLFTSSGIWWFYWPLLGWGIGLIIHAFHTFGNFWFFSKDWEEKKIRQLIEKEKKKNYR